MTSHDGSSAPEAGIRWLYDSLDNRGTAFTDEERRRLGLEGLLPPRVESLAEQVARVLEAVRAKARPLDKYLFLSALQRENETVFYRVVLDHLEEMLPIIYTPTVGEACLDWSRIYERPRGLYIAAAPPRPYRRDPEALATQPSPHHRRHRRGADPRPGRSGCQWDGYSDRQARAVHRVRRRAAGALPARDDRRGDEQRAAAPRPILSRQPRAAPHRRGLRCIARRVRFRGTERFSWRDRTVRRLQQPLRIRPARAVSGAVVLLQRRHPGHRSDGPSRTVLGGPNYRDASRRSAHPVRGRRRSMPRDRWAGDRSHAARGPVRPRGEAAVPVRRLAWVAGREPRRPRPTQASVRAGPCTPVRSLGHHRAVRAHCTHRRLRGERRLLGAGARRDGSRKLTTDRVRAVEPDVRRPNARPSKLMRGRADKLFSPAAAPSIQ